MLTLLIITYNSGNTILDTLNSLLVQEYMDQINIIISDDCSQDDTVILINKWLFKYQSIFKDVKLICNEVNLGVTLNCNRAMKYCTTKYVKFIAGDDIFVDKSIKKIIEYLNENQQDDLIVGKMYEFGNDRCCFDILSKSINSSYYQYHEEIKLINFATMKNIHDKLNNITTIAPSMIINVNTFYNLGGFNEKYKYFEDLPFIIKCLSEGKRIKFINEYLVFYRKSANSTTNVKQYRYLNLNFYYNYLDYYKSELKPFLKENRNHEVIWNKSIELIRNRLIISTGNRRGAIYYLTKPMVLLQTYIIKDYIEKIMKSVKKITTKT